MTHCPVCQEKGIGFVLRYLHNILRIHYFLWCWDSADNPPLHFGVGNSRYAGVRDKGLTARQFSPMSNSEIPMPNQIQMNRCELQVTADLRLQ